MISNLSGELWVNDIWNSILLNPLTGLYNVINPVVSFRPLTSHLGPFIEYVAEVGGLFLHGTELDAVTQSPLRGDGPPDQLPANEL